MISPAIAGFRPVTKTASRHESSSSLQAHGWCGRDRRCPPAPCRLRLQRQERLCHLGQASLFREQQHEGGRMALRDLCRNSSFLAVNVAIFLGGALELGLAQWLPAYAEMSLGFSKWTGSISLLAFSAAMALGRIFAGLIGRRVDPIKLMLSCCWTSVVLVLLACFAPRPAVALAASVAVGLAGSCLWPTTLGVAADRFPRGGASMFGLLAAFGNLGGILMPWLVGVTADWSSLRLGLATSTACPLLMAFVLLWMQRRPDAEFAQSGSALETRISGDTAKFGGSDGTRSRGLLRDGQVF